MAKAAGVPVKVILDARGTTWRAAGIVPRSYMRLEGWSRRDWQRRELEIASGGAVDHGRDALRSNDDEGQGI